MFAEITSNRRISINDMTRQVVGFMNLYQEKQKELFRKSVGGCACSACQSIENLHLKCAIHFGEVVEKQVEGRQELAGEAVILVHRLMKNSVNADTYLLATEAVSKELCFSPFPVQKSYQELVSDIGSTPVEVYFSQKLELDRENVDACGWATRKLEGLRLLLGWILEHSKKGRTNFHNIPM